MYFKKISKLFSLLLSFLINVSIYSQVFCSSGTSNIPRSGTVTLNGVTITTTYTGDVQDYPYSWSSCNGNVTTSTNALLVGGGLPYSPSSPSPWTITLNFSKPVNDLVIVLTATGTGGSLSNENFIFNSNGGAVSIAMGTNCNSTISSNQIFSGSGAPLDYSAVSGGGGGLFKISAPNAYSQLTINGNGGLNGSLMAICQASIKESNSCIPSATNPDSDGDNIADVCDYDDDNDGILDIIECPTATNTFYSYFNSGNYNASINAAGTNIQSTSASTIGSGLTRSIISPYNYMELTGIAATTEAMAITNNEYVEYSFTTNSKSAFVNNIGYYTTNSSSTGENTQYHFSARISNDNFASNNVLLNDKAYDSSAGTSVVPLSDGAYWLAPNTTYKVRVYFYAVNGGTTATIAHDDFSLLGYVECDTDEDSIPNRLDLDSDNDGCPDAIEGGAAFISSNLVNSAMPGGNAGATSGTYNQQITQNLGNTVNTTSSSTSYGVPTVAASGQAVGTSQTANPILIAGSAGANQTIVSGSTPTALSLSGASGSIQWQVSNDNTTFSNISGATNITYAPGTLTATRYYRAIITSVGGCTSLSNTVTINTVPLYDCTGKIYSLSSVTGEIRIFNSPASSGNLGAVINTATPPSVISGGGANAPNALGYSNATRKFYYVLNQNGGIGNTFVSYDPISNSYETLASTNGYIYRGTATNDGLGYYALTSTNTLKYYDIINNAWTNITNTFVDQNGISLNSILATYSGGDLAMDGNGDLWILAGTTTSTTAYVFKIKSTVPKTNIGATPLVLEQIVKQNIGISPNGISFNDIGELFITNIATIFKMNSNFSISTVGAISPSNGGGDLASCASPTNLFPLSDFGDAPDSYKTLLSSNGPRHTTSQYDATNNTAALMIGSKIDLENDATFNANADGDDITNINDENSAIFPILNTSTTSYTISVPVNNATGISTTLRGWIDFNKNNSFDASEATSVTVPNGATSASLTWIGLSNLTAGDTFYRLRIAKNDTDIALPYGTVFGGEVEDGKITIEAVCYRNPIINGSGTETKMGVTLLKRAGNDNTDNWPMVRKSGHIALESNTQGFVVTRIAKADLVNITNPQEGMMVYDTTDKCLKIYSDSAWKCFETPSCP